MPGRSKRTAAGVEEHQGIAGRDDHLARPLRSAGQILEDGIEAVEERRNHVTAGLVGDGPGTGEKILPHGP